MNSNRKTIFLVDDDLTNLTIGGSALTPHYDVITLNSGARLLKVLERKIPDLILLDIEMPGMNGYETLTQLKSHKGFRHIPVIFLSAKTEMEHEFKGFAMGAIDYILKPFHAAHLRSRIASHLVQGKAK